MEEEFKLRKTFPVFVRYLGIPLFNILLGLGLIAIIWIEWSPRRSGANAFGLLLVWLASIALMLRVWARTPTAIVLHSDGRVVFRGFWLHVETDSSSIHSIQITEFQPGLLHVKHSQGSFYMWNQFDGLYRFLTRLKELNPSVVLSGC